MDDLLHREILEQGVDVWNYWREENEETSPDLFEIDLHGARLSGANLRGANLRGSDLIGANLLGACLAGDNLSQGWLFEADLIQADLRAAVLVDANLIEADLSGADLEGANLDRANLVGANLSGANLSGARLRRASLNEANLRGANLSGANLSEANLSEADLSGANLTLANLEGANLVHTNFEDSILIGCRIFGASAWKLNLRGATQANLDISDFDEPIITVDNLEVAQFIYLLLNNERVRDVINTITTKVVLVLGRFTPERKTVLEAIREELRRQNYIPVLFDFDKPVSRDLTETVRTLAHLARFIIADITDPRSVPQELQAIVPGLAVPVQAVIQETQQPWGMFEDFPKKYHWVLAVHRYRDQEDLLASLREKVIGPAEAKAKELAGR